MYIKIDCFKTKLYYNDKDELHREDGPAIEEADGDKFWYQNRLLHRLDGPAIEYVDGSKMWYYHSNYIHCNSQEHFLKLIKLKAFW